MHLRILSQFQKLAIFLAAAQASLGVAQAVELKIADGAIVNVGLRVQTWAQWTEHGAADGSDKADFSARRVYFYAGGKISPAVAYFAHIAGDRLGQDGVDTPSLGLGTGLALRDGWMTEA